MKEGISRRHIAIPVNGEEIIMMQHREKTHQKKSGEIILESDEEI